MMTTFTKAEIDSFDRNPEAILEELKYRNVLEEYLRRKKDHQYKLKWVELWVEATRSLEDKDMKVGDNLIALMKILDIELPDGTLPGPEKENRKKMELMKKKRKDMLNDLKRKSVNEINFIEIKSRFIAYLKQYHSAKS